MIIIKLSGGLGNQLFQYAAGREMSLRLNTSIVFDANYYVYVRNRRYMLDSFRIQGRKTFPLELAWRRTQESITDFREAKYYSYDKKIEAIKGSVYLDGWWQNPNYFSGHWSQIRNELTFKHPKKIRLPKNSVSIHVRRGDYTSLEGFGVCSPEYYKSAIQKIAVSVKDPSYYVFSDDIPWARENLPFIPKPHYVSGQPEIEDLLMMTQCTHHIIANSTFSWWGSTLAVDQKGITIAPTPWLSTQQKETQGLYKKNWIILPKNAYAKTKK